MNLSQSAHFVKVGEGRHGLWRIDRDKLGAKRGYRKRGKSSKPAPTAWKDRLTGEDYDELVNTFQVFDEDGSGTIDPVEINKVLEELGLDKRNPFILNLINGLKDKNKPISQDEFIDIVASRVGETKTKDGIRKIFALYDKDDNGVVDFEEFKSIAKQLHDPINDDDLL